MDGHRNGRAIGRWCLAAAAAMAVALGGCTAEEDPAVTVAPALADLLAEEGWTGAVAVREVGASTTLVSEAAAASTQVVPASTFKVLHSLIALEEGVVTDVDEVVRWDGTVRDVEAWNQDHSLRTGIAVSAVWLYQEVARQVGVDAMRSHLAEVGYGNGQVGDTIDSFWLEGPLAVSTIDQVDLLDRLARGALPFSSDHQAAVLDILVTESSPAGDVRHKTGSALRSEPPVAWLVALVEHPDGDHTVALRLDAPGMELTSLVPTGTRVDLAARAVEAVAGTG